MFSSFVLKAQDQCCVTRLHSFYREAGWNRFQITTEASLNLIPTCSSVTSKDQSNRLKFVCSVLRSFCITLTIFQRRFSEHNYIYMLVMPQFTEAPPKIKIFRGLRLIFRWSNFNSSVGKYWLVISFVVLFRIIILIEWESITRKTELGYETQYINFDTQSGNARSS